MTGWTGFLGRHVVTALDRKEIDPDPYGSESARDLRRIDDTLALFTNYLPDVVIHCAGNVGGIGKNAERPGELFYDNLMMGVNVIEACKLNQVEKLVMIGTVCSYPNHTPVPFLEGDLWNGYPEETNAPYGIAKKALLTMCQAYRQQYGLNAIFLMPANLYGPGDNFDPETSHVIPAIIRKCVEARSRGDDSITLWGDGSATREFLYVEDAAEAIVLAAERYDGAEPVNIGTGVDMSIACIASMISNMTGFGREIIWDESKPNGQPRRCLDTSRAEAFGFKASTDFLAGLRKTIDCYCANAQA